MEELKLRFKSKKCKFSKISPNPFDKNFKSIEGTFNGISVDVINLTNDQLQFLNGRYGRNCNGSSKDYFVLDLEESVFLSGILNALVIKDLNDKELTFNELFDKATQIKQNFHSTLIGYIYLKSKNWVVKSGIKYGGDFLIYKENFQKYHASCLVIIYSNIKLFEPKNIQGIQRIAEASNKDLLILEIDHFNNSEALDFHVPENILKTINNYKISEILIRRCDLQKIATTKTF